MAVIDSLEVDIQAKSEAVNKSLDDLLRRLGLVAEGISAIGKNEGLTDFAKKAADVTKGFASIQNVAKSISASIEPQMQKVAKSFEQITEQYKNLGKGFVFKGSANEIQKQIDKYTNSLEVAKLKKEELETAGKTEGKAYEAAVAKTIEYTNVIESLKQQLADVQAAQPQFNFNISGIEETRQAIESVRESIRETVSIPESAFDYNAEAMAAVFGEAAGSIEDWAHAVEIFGTNAGQAMNESTQPDFNISGLEEAGQDLNSLSGQLQNMKNLFSQTFADLKSGDIFRYLSESAQDFVKKAQLAAGVKIHTEEYRTLQGDIERSEKALEKLQQKQRDMEAAGTSTESAEWQKVAAQITTAENRLDSYINKRNEMESSGADVEFTGGLANQSAIKNIGVVAGEAMAALRQKLGEIPGAVSQAVGNIPVIGRVAKEAAFLGKAAFEGFESALSGVAKAVSEIVSAVSKIASAVSKLVSSIKNAVSKLSGMAKSFIGLKGASKGMNASLGGGLKTILRYTLGIRSFYMLVNKLRTAMKDSFKNLAQYSSETNTSISMLQSSLGALKNSLSVAFAPIVNVIAPYLSAFIDMLTRAFNAVGRFFAALTGKTFAAQAVKNFSDYAAGAGKADKAAEKLYSTTLGIDELNINAGDKNDGSSAGSGAGEISAQDMFETVPIESDMLDFVQKVKDAWTGSDFTEIGSILGLKLKNALDGIEWEPIKENAAKIGESLGTLLNGIVETEGLADSIGHTIGEAVNTGITGTNAFLDDTHWDTIGIFIGEGLNGIVDTVDWEGLGHLFAAKWNAVFEVLGNAATTFDWADLGSSLATSVNTFITDFDWAENGAHLGELAKGLLDSIVTFLEEVDWQELGNGIADFIGGIDWGGILERLAEGIGAAIGGLAALLWGLIEDAWNSVVEWWQETAFEDGQFTISGLLEGIMEALADIATWIYEHIFEPFVNGFREAFDIHSPSGVMEEQGGFLMEGLFNGISSLVDKVVGVFTKIKDKIIEVWNTVKAKTTEIWEGVKNAVRTPINAIIGFINGMISGVVSGINSMTSALNNIQISVPDWVPGMGGKSLGFEIPQISAPQIPYLAKGGIAMQYTPAFIGEAGAEAILPLTNDRAMGMIADSIMKNADYGYGGGGDDIKGMIREAVHEEVSYLVQSIAPYLGDISQNTRETADKDMSLNLDGRELIGALDEKNQSMGFNFGTGMSRGRLAF